MDEKEHKMASYGRHELNPIEFDGQAKQIIARDAIRHKNHLATKGGTKHWKGVIPPDPNTVLNYYNEQKERRSVPRGYDTMFHIKHDYNSHLHRDDREHTVGLNVNEEELNRSVPVLSSSAYGRRVDRPFEDPTSLRKYVRIERVWKGFSRTRGTGIPTSTDQATKEHKPH